MTTWLNDQARLQELRDERDEAISVGLKFRELLQGFVEGETEPCRFDHHGCCQEHGWFGEPGECGVREAREMLGIA